ncbi:tetratricopeptide repeat protein [Streptomyces sioyaensis]|uniref:tetratricopeptide repeat protein n=1 Tax=Streptomyces sioyaensis TaxID=67364 RepID=UPI003717D33D
MSSDASAADDVGPVDPATVYTLEELARAFQRLKGSRSYADLDKAVNPNRRRNGPRVLSPSTLSNLLNGKSVPVRATVETFLTACGLDTAAQEPWLTAWERVANRNSRRPVSAVRVREARPRLLGVHAAIRVDGAADELPPYVPRDLDAELRTALAAAAVEGGFVLLTGGSSVGKTRALYETLRVALPEWWLLHPADAGSVVAHTAAPTPRTVLWLDELQDYLNHPTGLPAGAIRQLITAHTVVVATMWHDEHSLRTTRAPAGQADPYANDRDLLGLACTIQVPDRFSPAEQRRGDTLASTDQRIRIALDATDAGFTQILAAGPALIQRWEAANCYGKAVITAVLDARRVGARRPATREFLEAAVPAYLTEAQQAKAPVGWLDQALDYASTEVQGAAACLSPASAGMGLISGYTPAAFLDQHARRVRRAEALSAEVWQALLQHHHPDDRLNLARNADARGFPGHAEKFYSLAAEVVPPGEAQLLLVELHAELLVKLRRFDEAIVLLRPLAERGDPTMSLWLADLYTSNGQPDEAEALLLTCMNRRDASSSQAAFYLTRLLMEQQREADLQARVDEGDWSASVHLAELLAEQGRIDDLSDRAQSGDRSSAAVLVNWHAKHGHLEALYTRSERGDNNAAIKLGELLVAQNKPGQAIELLRSRAGDDATVAMHLAPLLAEQGRTDEAIDIVQHHVTNGERGALFDLCDLLATSGRIDEAIALLQTHVKDQSAVFKLASLLSASGKVDDAITLLESRINEGDQFAAFPLAQLLAEEGRIEQLRDRADAGDGFCARALIKVLAERGQLDELRGEVNAGTLGAFDYIAGRD